MPESLPRTNRRSNTGPLWARALDPGHITRFRRGVKLGFPIFLGYMPVGMAFGILARTNGFSVAQAVICSATALAGAGQFIALSFLGAGASVTQVLIATTVVNLRYVLFASTLSPYLKGVPISAQALLAYSLTDETFAVNIADRRQGLSTVGSMIGVGAIAWTGWVLGTALGAAGTQWIGDPSRFGVGFAMPAMFTALFLALAENRRHVVIGILAGGLVLALQVLGALGLHVTSSWALIIASMTAATVGAVIWRES
ncbi:MAG: AzlC family ABC transporter permease [Coriobacteriia bacterium]|nr:AzlC family ABC transporter permease [Coriobacteriia bacterium]